MYITFRQETRAAESLGMVSLTLEKMAKGGIYDQIGGGFHRYSTDAHWLVPHFEKMLYDNALLSRVYLHAYLITKTPLFRHVAEEAIDYVLREMTDRDGGFYSTQDADSEGSKGKYYTWTTDEIREALGGKTASTLSDYYNMTASGNFEGRSILHIAEAQQFEESNLVKQAKALLLREREKRVRPGRDEKILASWNGLMLASLAEASGILGRKDYLDAATSNASFLMNSMTSEGYLKHVYSHDQSKIDGYLEDYALVIDGLLNLHQASLTGKWLKEAIRLCDVMVEEFWEEQAGIFFDTGKRHQALFVRPKSTHDTAIPSGSSAAVMALLKISRITRNRKFEQIVERSFHFIHESLSSYPLAYGNWLCVLDFYLSIKKDFVIVGPSDNISTVEMMRALFGTWLPNKVVVALDPKDPTAATEVELLNSRSMVNEQPTVYVCEGHSCRTPVTDTATLRDQLK